MGYFDTEEKAPIEKKTRGVKEKHPFSKLAVGESFSIPEGVHTLTMQCNAYQRGQRLGRKFKVDGTKRTVERVK